MKKNISESPIYQKIDYQDAVFAKRILLMAEIDMLNCLRTLSNYKELRKQELMLKLKVKNDLTDVKNHISKIIDNSPKTEIIEKMLKEKPASIKTGKDLRRKKEISEQLIEIREKLNAMN